MQFIGQTEHWEKCSQCEVSAGTSQLPTRMCTLRQTVELQHITLKLSLSSSCHKQSASPWIPSLTQAVWQRRTRVLLVKVVWHCAFPAGITLSPAAAALLSTGPISKTVVPISHKNVVRITAVTAGTVPRFGSFEVCNKVGLTEKKLAKKMYASNGCCAVTYAMSNLNFLRKMKKNKFRIWLKLKLKLFAAKLLKLS